MKEGRQNFAITHDSRRNEIYVLGGRGWFFNDFICLENCEKYSIDNDEWTPLSPLANKKMNASACMVGNDYIYVIGGYYGHSRQPY